MEGALPSEATEGDRDQVEGCHVCALCLLLLSSGCLPVREGSSLPLCTGDGRSRAPPGPAELRAQREAGAPQSQPPLSARSQGGQAVCLKRDSQHVNSNPQYTGQSPHFSAQRSLTVSALRCSSSSLLSSCQGPLLSGPDCGSHPPPPHTAMALYQHPRLKSVSTEAWPPPGGALTLPLS